MGLILNIPGVSFPSSLPILYPDALMGAGTLWAFDASRSDCFPSGGDASSTITNLAADTCAALLGTDIALAKNNIAAASDWLLSAGKGLRFASGKGLTIGGAALNAWLYAEQPDLLVSLWLRFDVAGIAGQVNDGGVHPVVAAWGTSTAPSACHTYNFVPCLVGSAFAAPLAVTSTRSSLVPPAMNALVNDADATLFHVVFGRRRGWLNGIPTASTAEQAFPNASAWSAALAGMRIGTSSFGSHAGAYPVTLYRGHIHALDEADTDEAWVARERQYMQAYHPGWSVV